MEPVPDDRIALPRRTGLAARFLEVAQFEVDRFGDQPSCALLQQLRQGTRACLGGRAGRRLTSRGAEALAQVQEFSDEAHDCAAYRLS
jgi:hypothetical protein